MSVSDEVMRCWSVGADGRKSDRYKYYEYMSYLRYLGRLFETCQVKVSDHLE